MKHSIKTLLLFLFAVLISFSLAACSDPAAQPQDGESTSSDSTTLVTGPVQKTGVWETATYLENTAFGNGTRTVVVEVKAEGQSVTFTIQTDKDTVGAALLEHNLITGEEGPFGMYVKAVNGMVADADTDRYYWAFYINGEYAMTGVDSTDITEGVSYSLVYERA